MTRFESPVNLQDNEKHAAGPPAALEPPETKPINKFLVKLEPHEVATAYPRRQKWWTLIVVCSSALCVTSASSMATSTLPHIEKEFHVGTEVAILSISLFIMGLGVGPLITGGMSEFVGRNIIYRLSFIAFFLLNFPVAFARDIVVHLIFRFLSGFGGAAFLSLGGGSIADLFKGPKFLSGPVAIYALAPFLGPVLGPIVSGFINQYASWRWTYYVLIIWVFLQTIALHTIPETYAPTLTNRKAARLREATGDDRHYSPFGLKGRSLLQTMKLSIMRPFLLMSHEPMVALLNIWTSLQLAIIYITFSTYPVIFGVVRDFTSSQIGLAFLGLGIGTVSSTASQPCWNALDRRVVAEYAALGQKPPPETMLYMAMAGAVLAPIGLYMFAFTVYKHVHWIVPIIAMIPFGCSVVLSFTATFNFFVQTYRPHAASAMASNSFMRSSFAAALPLASRPMFKAMTNTGAIAFLAGVMTVLAPLPFVFFKFGPRLRKHSKYALARE